MIPALLLFAAGSMPGDLPRACAAPFAPERRARVAAASLAGIPGLFEVPAAVSVPDRSSTLALNTLRSLPVPDGTTQRNAFLGIGFAPRLTLVARGSWMNGAAHGSSLRDISAGAQLLLAREGGWTPALAAGAQDFGGAHPFFTNRYLVASKSFVGRARLTAGYGSTMYSLDGIFGGVELAPCAWLSLIAENDGRRRNAGVRISPLGDWGARRGVEPAVDLLWRQGQGRTLGIGLRIQSASPGRERAGAATPAASTAHATGDASVSRGAGGLGDALGDHGFENIRTGRVGDTLTVAYENRVFNRDEWDALGIVMAEATQQADGARVMRVTLLRMDLPVLEVVSGIEAFERFARGAMDRAAFAAQLGVAHPSAVEAGVPANSSRFRVDATVRPRVEQLPLTNFSDFEARAILLPEASVRVARGVTVTARRALLVHRTRYFPADISPENADQLLVHVARVGLPFGGRAGGMVSQVSAGRFGPDRVGLAGSFDDVVARGRVSIGGVVGAFGERADSPTHSVAYGSVRYRHGPSDAVVSLTAGRFARGDVGGVGEMERRFGLSEVALFVESTNFSSMAGIRVTVPLAFARDSRPRALRVRLPGYTDMTKRSGILTDLNVIRWDVANPLETGQEMGATFRGRDRLNGPRLVREVYALREAANTYVYGTH